MNSAISLSRYFWGTLFFIIFFGTSFVRAQTGWIRKGNTSYSSAFIAADGKLYTWGYNNFGQLGNGTTINKSIPTQIGSSTNWVNIASGQYHTMAIKSDGTLWAWGQNTYGQLGDGTNTYRTSPFQIGTATNWASISCGQYYTLAIKTDGTLWAWGQNSYTQLGDGTSNSRNTPGQIGTATNWATVACGYYHSIAVKTDGTLWAWGNNVTGQLGDGTTTPKSTPNQIGTANNWSIVTCGQYYSLAIKTDGTLWAWGYNLYGQLGDGTTVNKSNPIQVGSSSNWTSVTSALISTLAKKSDGSIWAWGDNSYGELGDGTNVSKSSPTKIGIDTTWNKIEGGYQYFTALKTDGSIWSWGKNDYGQLGDNTTQNKNAPTRIYLYPVISTSGSFLNFSTCNGTNSSVQSFSVSGVGLTVSITITAPTGFEISTNPNNGFASSKSITPVGVIVGTTSFYVRLNGNVVGNFSGDISSTTTGATTQNISVSGTVLSTSTSNTNASVCSNSLPYVWNGNNYSNSGNYTLHFTNSVGCDSAASLNLNVITSTSNITTITACDNYTWSENNQTYSSSGTYNVVNGCHTEILDLTIIPSTSNTTTITACDNYTWLENNQTYSSSGTYNVVNGCHTEVLELTINQSPIVSAGNNLSICLGQTVTLNGNGAINYSWSSDVFNGVAFTPIATNTYSVVGTDANGCSSSSQVTVTVHPLPIINAGIDQVVCPGSSTILTANGANNYFWNNGVVNNVSFTPIEKQTYTVTGIDNNGCINFDSVVVRLKIFNLIASTPKICNGKFDTLSAPIGTNYVWKKNGSIIANQNSQTLVVNKAANYTATFTDVQCGIRTSPTFSLIIIMPPTRPLISPTVANYCVGNSIILSGSSGYQMYNWYLGTNSIFTSTSPDFNTNTPGTYKLTVTDTNNCVSSLSNPKTVKAVNPPNPNFTILSYSNGTKKLSSVSGGAYQWYLNDAPIVGATMKSYLVAFTGIYSLIVTNTLGCSATSNDTMLIASNYGPKINDEETLEIIDNEISVYPNPSTGLFNFTGVELLKAIVKDMKGIVIFETTEASNLNLTEKASGVYIVQFFNLEGALIKQMKLVKE